MLLLFGRPSYAAIRFTCHLCLISFSQSLVICDCLFSFMLFVCFHIDASGTVKKTGGNFKEKLRDLGGLDVVFDVAVNCHSTMEVWACMFI